MAMMKALIWALAFSMLAGCASLGGNATYEYSRTSAEVCTLNVDSGRVLSAGVDVSLIGCDVTVTAGKVEQGTNSLESVTGLINAIKAVPTVPSKGPQ